GMPVIAIRGPGGAASDSGLLVTGGSTTVRGLAVGRFQEGIEFDGPGNNIVEGNFVGIEPNGTTAIANSDNGVWLRSGTGNTVGGTVAAARNVISGNEDDGVDIDPDTSGNLVLGNFIGTDATGLHRLGNDDDAVDID